MRPPPKKRKALPSTIESDSDSIDEVRRYFSLASCVHSASSYSSNIGTVYPRAGTSEVEACTYSKWKATGNRYSAHSVIGTSEFSYDVHVWWL